VKSKKKLPIIMTCLAALVVVLAVIHFTTRTKVPEGSISVETGGKVSYLVLTDIPTSHVEGEIVNGKGEIKSIDGEGIRLEDALALAGVTNPKRVTAVADDEYNAVIEGDEIAHDAQVYLMVENGEGRLVVFGDLNSKRNVSHLTRLVVE